jgi:hypothetical protein
MRHPEPPAPQGFGRDNPPIEPGWRASPLRRGDIRPPNWLAAPTAHIDAALVTVGGASALIGVLAAFDIWCSPPWLLLGLALAYALIGLEQRGEQLPTGDRHEERADDL